MAFQETSSEWRNYRMRKSSGGVVRKRWDSTNEENVRPFEEYKFDLDELVSYPSDINWRDLVGPDDQIHFTVDSEGIRIDTRLDDGKAHKSDEGREVRLSSYRGNRCADADRAIYLRGVLWWDDNHVEGFLPFPQVQGLEIETSLSYDRRWPRITLKYIDPNRPSPGQKTRLSFDTHDEYPDHPFLEVDAAEFYDLRMGEVDEIDASVLSWHEGDGSSVGFKYGRTYICDGSPGETVRITWNGKKAVLKDGCHVMGYTHDADYSPAEPGSREYEYVHASVDFY